MICHRPLRDDVSSHEVKTQTSQQGEDMDKPPKYDGKLSNSSQVDNSMTIGSPARRYQLSVGYSYSTFERSLSRAMALLPSGLSGHAVPFRPRHASMVVAMSVHSGRHLNAARFRCQISS